MLNTLATISLFLAPAAPGQAAQEFVYLAPFPESFETRSCPWAGPLLGTCTADAQAEGEDGLLSVHAETTSPKEGRLPGGSRSLADAGFILRPFLGEPASSVSFVFDYVLHGATVTSRDTTFGWNSGGVQIVAWTDDDACDCYSQTVVHVVDLNEGNQAGPETGTVVVTLSPPEGSIPAGFLFTEIRLLAHASLTGLAGLGDRGRVSSDASATIERVVVRTSP